MKEHLMKRSVACWQLAGFLFTSVMGTFLHFLFDLSGQSIVAAIFSAVNESIWEHTKLIYYPMLIFALVEYCFCGKDRENFWCVKLAGILLALVLIPVIYYTYSGILGVSVDWLNITIFFIAAAAAFWLENKLFEGMWKCPIPQWAAFGIICLIGILFTVFTFLPPQIPFFEDPITGTYGYQP